MTKVAMIGVGKLGQACAEVMAETYPLVGYKGLFDLSSLAMTLNERFSISFLSSLLLSSNNSHLKIALKYDLSSSRKIFAN